MDTKIAGRNVFVAKNGTAIKPNELEGNIGERKKQDFRKKLDDEFFALVKGCSRDDCGTKLSWLLVSTCR